MAKKVETKKTKIDNKMIIGIVVVVVVAVLLVLLLTNVFKKDNKKSNNNNEPKEEKVISDEKSIEKDYNYSKEDAIKSVKRAYNSDNYTFSATANEDNTYTVTVVNTENQEVTKYIVDPNDGSFYLKEDE